MSREPKERRKFPRLGPEVEWPMKKDLPKIVLRKESAATQKRIRYFELETMGRTKRFSFMQNRRS